MKQIKLLSVTFIMLAFVINMASAQVEMPQPSPFGKLEQKVGLTDFTIEYSRPSVRDRVIFGDLVHMENFGVLVPMLPPK